VTTAQIVSNGAAQATVFSHVVGTLGRPGDLPPVLDLEDAGTLNPAQLSLWTHAWLERAARLTGHDAIVYTNVSFWRQSMANSPEFAMYPLWLADYGVRQPARVGGWKRCVFWQYTETGRMAGAGLNVDLSVFNGSRAQLKAMTVTPAAASAAAAAASATLNDTMLARQPAGSTRTGATRSRSDLGSWLRAFGMGRSGAIAGYWLRMAGVASGCTVNIPADQRHDHGGDPEDLGSTSECRWRNAPDLSRIQSCDRKSWEKPEGLDAVAPAPQA